MQCLIVCTILISRNTDWYTGQVSESHSASADRNGIGAYVGGWLGAYVKLVTPSNCATSDLASIDIIEKYVI